MEAPTSGVSVRSQAETTPHSSAAEAAEPTFSILTPVYKTGAFVAQTIRSVLAQTRDDWELLLVDNACPDDGALPVRPFLRDPRITLRSRPINEGVAIARNELLVHARGDYVVQLDSDDWLEPDYLDTVARVLGADPGAGIAAPNAARFEDATGLFADQTMFELCQAPAVDDHERTLEHLLRVNYVAPPFSVRRDALVAAGGWDVAHEGIEDLALLCELLLGGWRMRTIPHPICVYRVRTHSTAFDETGTEKLEIRQRREEFLETLLGEGSLPEGARRQAARSLSRSRVRTAIIAGDAPAARRVMWGDLRGRPSAGVAALALAHLAAPGRVQRLLRAR